MVNNSSKPSAKKTAAAASSSSAGGTGAPKPSRFLGRRSTEDGADRALQDQFPDTPLHVLTQRKVDGMSLRDRVIYDRRHAKGSKARLGAKYWNHLKNMYIGEQPDEMLTVRNKSDIIQKSLIAALQQATNATSSQRSKASLVSFLQTTDSLNQREWVGICRHLITLKPGQSQVNLSCIIEAMKCVVRLGMANDFQQEVACLHELIDEALAHSLSSFKKNNLKVEVWWSSHKDIASLVIDTEIAARVMASPENPAAVAGDISTLVSVSKLGAKLFRHLLPAVLSHKVAVAVQKLLNAMPQKVTSSAIESAISGALKEMDDHNADEHLSTKRTILLRYRDIDKVSVQVSSVAEEIRMRIYGWVKTRALQNGDLKEMKFEKGLFKEVDKSATKTTIEASALEELKACRGAFNDIAAQSPQEGCVLIDLLHKKTQALLNIDAAFSLEIAAFDALHTTIGVARMQKAIRDILPTEASPSNIHVLKLGVERIQSSALYKFGSKDVQNVADSLHEMLTGMSAGTPPAQATDGAEDMPFLTEVMLALQYLLQAKNGEQTISGPAAMEDKIKKLEVLSSSSKLAFDDLNEVHAFAWFMTADQSARVKALTDGLLKNMTAASKRKRKHDNDKTKGGDASSANDVSAFFA